MLTHHKSDFPKNSKIQNSRKYYITSGPNEYISKYKLRHISQIVLAPQSSKAEPSRCSGKWHCIHTITPCFEAHCGKSLHLQFGESISTRKSVIYKCTVIKAQMSVVRLVNRRYARTMNSYFGSLIKNSMPNAINLTFPHHCSNRYLITKA